jgi:hypothetical protein
VLRGPVWIGVKLYKIRKVAEVPRNKYFPGLADMVRNVADSFPLRLWGTDVHMNRELHTG